MRSIYADWERGDFGAAKWAAPDVEYVLVDGPTPGSWRGLSAMNQAWRDYLIAWEAFRVNADEYRELDNERVLVLIRRRGRGKTSGVQISDRGADVFHVCDGRVIRLVSYPDRDVALADLGVKE